MEQNLLLKINGGISKFIEVHGENLGGNIPESAKLLLIYIYTLQEDPQFFKEVCDLKDEIFTKLISKYDENISSNLNLSKMRKVYAMFEIQNKMIQM